MSETLADQAVPTAAGALPGQLAPPPPVAPEAVAAAQAIQRQRRGDTLGAMSRLRHNLGRNALLLGHGVAVAYSTALQGVDVAAIPGGVAYETAATTVLATGVYQAARWRERHQVRQAEIRQQIVRNELAASVDIFRPKNPTLGKERTTVLRWYGLDAGYTAAAAPAAKAAEAGTPPIVEPATRRPGGPNVESMADELRRVVSFAETTKIPAIALSPRVLDLLPQAKAGETYGLSLPNKAITSGKSVEVIDKLADETVLYCTTAEVKKLLEDINPLDRVLRLLAQARPEHPFIAQAEEFKTLGSPAALRSRLRKGLRPRIEQTASNGISLIRRLDRVTGEVTLGREHTVARLDRTQLELTGVAQTMSIARNPDQGADGAPSAEASDDTAQTRIVYGRQQAAFKSREELLAAFGFESLGEMLHATEDRCENLAPHDLQERAEAMAWLLLQDTPPPVTRRKTDAAAGAMAQPLQARVAAQPLRSIGNRIRKTPASAGLDYEGAPGRAKRVASAVGLIVAASAIGVAAGYGTHTAANKTSTRLEDEYAAAMHYNGRGDIPPGGDAAMQSYIDSRHDPLALFARADQAASDANEVVSKAVARRFHYLYHLDPTLDPDDIIHKQIQLEGLDNAYTGNNDEAFLGDVPLDKNAVSWELTPVNGASTGGYWPQQVYDRVVASSTKILPTPPYRDYGMVYLVPEYTVEPATDPHYLRTVPLQSPEQLPADAPLIKVEGKKYFASNGVDMSLVTLPDGNGYNMVQYGYALPVQQGADIVAATATRYSLRDGSLLPVPAFNVVQLPDGVFYMVFRSVPDATESYMNVSYWLKPQAGTARPVRAEAVMTVASDDTVIETPLAEKLSTEQALRIWRQLSGDPTATHVPTAEEAAKMVHDRKGYSRTPYLDGRIGNHRSNPRNDSEGLTTIGETAAALPKTVCNLATTIVLLASRGQSQDGIVNPTTGYYNNGDSNHGDNKLTVADSHEWLTTGGGSKVTASGRRVAVPPKIIDGTPSGYEQPVGSGDASNPLADPADVLTHRAIQVAAGLGTAGVTYLTIRSALAVRRRQESLVLARTQKVAEAAAPPPPDLPDLTAQTEPGTPRQHDLLSIIQWLQFAPAADTLDDTALPIHFATRHQQDLGERANTIQVMSAKELRKRIDQLERQGRLQLSDQTKVELVALARRHKRTQTALQRQASPKNSSRLGRLASVRPLRNRAHRAPTRR